MRVSFRRKMKEKMVDEMSRRWEGKDGFLFINFEGLDSRTIDGMRAHLKKSGVRVSITKNSIIELAMRKNGVEIPAEALRRPTAVLWGDADIVDICKAFVSWEKGGKEVAIKGVYAFGKMRGVEQFDEVMKLPSRKSMHTTIVGLFAGGFSLLLSLMSSHLQRLLLCMEEHYKKMGEKEGGKS
ncbi:MAG: 50S ribosomal protein L10 [Planctomycetota bacterium]|nr:50S ribosomal protein L10 [Planctomycetota bacterium]